MSRSSTVVALVAVVGVTNAAGCSCSNLTIVPADAGSDAGLDAGPDAGICGRELFFDGGGTVVAAGLNRPRRLAMDDRFFYVSVPGLPLEGDGQLLRVPLDGGAATPILSNLESPESVAMTPTALYVVEAGGVWRIERSGLGVAQVSLIHTGSIFGGTDIQIVGEDAIVATASRWLEQVVPDGGAPALLYAGDAGATVHGAVLENGSIFFLVADVAEGGIYRVPLDGSGPATQILSDPSIGSSFALTPVDFVWSDVGGGLIRSAHRDGGAPITLASGLCDPSRLTVVGSIVYFKDSTACGSGSSRSFLQQASVCSSGQGIALGPTGFGPGDLVIDGGTLYFTSAGSGDAGLIGTLP